MELDKAIQSRHSTKRFKDKEVDWKDIFECIDAARYAPMAGNIFSPKFILVDDKDKIQRLSEAAQQPFISNASHVIVVCSNESKTVNAYEKRGEKYLRQQAGAAMQNILLKLTEKSLDSCWVGHFVDRIVKEILKIPKDIQIEAMIVVGYAYVPRHRKRKKVEIQDVLYFNEYKNKRMDSVKKIDA